MTEAERHDYVSRASYIGSTHDGLPYMCISRVFRNPPSFEMVPIPKDKKGRLRKRYLPPYDTIQVELSDGSAFWTGEISYEAHNVGRKKAGGRDDTWGVDRFMYKVWDALHYITDRPHTTINVKPSADGETVLLEIKENDKGLIWNYLKDCQLEVDDSSLLTEFLPLFKQSIHSYFVDICRTGNISKAKSRVLQDFEVNQMDENGWTCLQYASYFGHLDIVEWLVDTMGADIELTQNPNQTPIALAAEKDYIDCVLFLESRGAALRNGVTSEETAVSVLLKHRYQSSISRVCGDDGPIAALTKASHGVRSTSPIVGMFQLP